MAATSKLNTSVGVYVGRSSPSDACTTDSATTTEDIVRELMAKGIPIEKIRIPGKVESHILHIADDFDAPLDDFKDYL